MNPNGLEAPVQVRLAALWASTMFLYVYADIIAFYKRVRSATSCAAVCGSSRSPRDGALGALALMTAPSVMIALSVLLPTRTNQWTNIVVASLFILVSIGNPIGETWAFDDLSLGRAPAPAFRLESRD